MLVRDFCARAIEARSCAESCVQGMHVASPRQSAEVTHHPRGCFLNRGALSNVENLKFHVQEKCDSKNQCKLFCFSNWSARITYGKCVTGSLSSMLCASVCSVVFSHTALSASR